MFARIDNLEEISGGNMDTQNVTQFLDRLSSDASFRAQLYAINSNKITDVLDFAFSKDFVFTEKDLKSALATYAPNPTIDQLRQQLKVPAQPARTV
jgi:hypothetical protein